MADLPHHFDVAALLEHYGRGELLELAASKDAGFTPATLVDALRAIDRLTPGDWEEDGVDVGPPTAATVTAVWWES